MSDPFVTPWTVACKAPLSVGFPREEYWSGLLFPSPGDLLHPGMEPTFDSLPLSHQGSPIDIQRYIRRDFFMGIGSYNHGG